MATVHNDGSITLTAEERKEILQVVCDLYFPARAHGPVPMQVKYWDELMAQQKRCRDLLALTEQELSDAATTLYNQITYGE